jgi:hypothetical protein
VGSQDRVDGVEALLDGATPALRVVDRPPVENAEPLVDNAREARRALP